MMHYKRSFEEIKAERFIDRGDYNARPHPICENGSFHAEETRDAAKVDCPICLACIKEGHQLRYNVRAAIGFAHHIKALGFKVYLAKAQNYGFITDENESRVMSFEFNGLEEKLAGNYGPPSRSSGTGWRLRFSPSDLKNAHEVRKALYSTPDFSVGTGWKYYTTVKQHLDMYQASSQYSEV